MITRDAYVKKLKEQLDRWNADIVKLDAKSKPAVAGMKDAYARQLRELHAQRIALERQMGDIQKASAGAWNHLRGGADKAWQAMEESFRKAWSDFK